MVDVMTDVIKRLFKENESIYKLCAKNGSQDKGKIMVIKIKVRLWLSR